MRSASRSFIGAENTCERYINRARGARARESESEIRLRYTRESARSWRCTVIPAYLDARLVLKLWRSRWLGHEFSQKYVGV